MSSSSDGDLSGMNSTADETVSLMSDTTNIEKGYYRSQRLWGSGDHGRPVHCWRTLLLSPGVFSLLLGLLLLIVGVWALVQGNTSYFSIVYTVAALLITVGVIMSLGGITHIFYLRFSGVQNKSTHCKRVFFISSVYCFFSLVVFFIAVTQTPRLSNNTIQLDVNDTTFKNYLSNQIVQNDFNDVQYNLKCCGVVAFTDYESIFNNLSVPVSCCNTTNPLANETTCPKIVSNAQQANETGLIYSEGCAPKLESILQHTLNVVAPVIYFMFVSVLLCYISVFIFICHKR